MRRNTASLSDHDLFIKTIDLIEYATNSKIQLQHSRRTNWCVYNGYNANEKLKQYTVNLANPSDKHIPKYTALLHELAHILYESPFTPIKKLLQMWSQDNSAKYKFYFAIFNILEDQRIESHLTRAYLGYKKKFDRTTTDLGKNLKSNVPNDPSYILLAIRFKRDDLVKKSKNYEHYKKAIDDVARTDRFGGLRVLISIRKYIDEYRPNSNPDEYTNPLPGMPNTSSDPLNLPPPRMPETPQKRDQKNDKFTSPDYKIPDELGKSDYTETEIDEILQDGKTGGEKQFQEVRDQLLGIYREDNTPVDVTKIKRKEIPYKIDYRVAKGMNKIFRKLKLRNKSFIDITGHEVDVDEYIENIIKGTNINKSYENIQRVKGVSIVISIDASGSMDHPNGIPIARNLVSTLYESIKGIPNIELRGNVWAGNGEGSIGITEINNIRDVKKISTCVPYLSTPTHMGFEYSMRMLREMKGEKKLLILVTDGMPNYVKHGRSIPNSVYDKQCKKSLQKVLGITPNIVCFLIGRFGMTDTLIEMKNDLLKKLKDPKLISKEKTLEELREIQEEIAEYELQQTQYENNHAYRTLAKIMGKKRLIPVDNMKNGSEKIVKQFKQFVLKNMVNPIWWEEMGFD